MHIPKTGGTSFSKFLDLNFNFDEIYKVHFNRQINKVPFLKSYKLIRGHFFSHKIFFKKTDNFRLITFFRDPYERYISQFKHISRLNFRSADLDLLSNNFYSKWIMRDKFYPIINFENFSEDFIINECLKRLNDFFHLGLVEKYSESIHMVSIYLNSRPLNIEKEMVSKNNLYNSDNENNEEILSQWKKANSIDEIIYKYAQEIFDKKKKLTFNLFDDEKNKKKIFENFIEINNKFGGKNYNSINHDNEDAKTLFQCAYFNYLKNYSDIHIVSQNKNFFLDGKSKINGDGWHRREFIQDDASLRDILNFIPYYWSGPEKKSDIHIPNWIFGNINLEIDIKSINNKIKPLDIIIKLNGSPFILKIINDKFSSNIKITAKGFAKESSLPFSVLSFEVPEVQKISEIYNNDDHRLVGFAFNKITISKI
jgi:hypothetical protein